MIGLVILVNKKKKKRKRKLMTSTYLIFEFKQICTFLYVFLWSVNGFLNDNQRKPKLFEIYIFLNPSNLFYIFYLS